MALSDLLKIGSALVSLVDKAKEAISAWRRRAYEKTVDRYLNELDDDGLLDIVRDIESRRNKRRSGS